MALARVLIANRGEIAIRIARAATSLGIESVCVYAQADADSLHVRAADAAHLLPGADPVSAYLDPEAIVDAAVKHGCDSVHPGYGFLSESAELAERCAAAGLKFVGPPASALELFGDKVAARSLARSLDIPVVPGSDGPVADAGAAARAAGAMGYPVMLKASHGGGGRGMRVIEAPAELTEAFERCSSEALAAFGDGTLFLEKRVHRPRHIEVQVLADGTGDARHLYERDCSVQLRHQKVVEIAPAANLPDGVAERLRTDAVRLVKAADYANAGTVEFLVEPESGAYYYIECNPRIQVEHTVTEEVLGLDLVEAQLRVAGGEALAALGLGSQDDVGPPRGFAVQTRVVVRGGGTIRAYKEPSGVGVRVDGYGYSGYAPPPYYDPLIAKVIARSNSTGTLASAISRARAALSEFQLNGAPNNIDQLRAILQLEEVMGADARTTLFDEQSARIGDAGPRPPAIAFLDAQTRMLPVTEAAQRNKAVRELPDLEGPAGSVTVEAPMSGSVVAVETCIGDTVDAGDPLVVVNAMKMEASVEAPCAGTVVALQVLASGDQVTAGQTLAVIVPDAGEVAQAVPRERTWAPLLDDVAALQAIAHARFAPDSADPGVVRQRNRGKLTCRERIDLLLDAGTFREVGSLAGFASYDEDGLVADFTPANHVGGWGCIDGRNAIVCADDFTSRGGHADGAIGQKSQHLDKLSIEWRCPSIRLLDGSSGGGSVAAMVPQQKRQGESGAKESSGAIRAGRPRVAGTGGSFLPGHLGSEMYAQQLSAVPVVNVLLGSVVGIGAAKAVLGHFSVMVRDIAQLFVAGPPVVSHAMGYDVTKEDLGDWRIHCTNGSVDNLAESEREAMAMTRRFLSYLPASVYDAPPVARNNDPAERREEELFTLIPRKRTATFDVRKAIRLMADVDSFFEIGALWGTDQVVGFARFDGHPVGVIASDSRHANGGALTADGCDKLRRHIDLCDLFHVPLLNLVDNPGFAVGIEHEIAGTIRKGGEWMVAFSQIHIPVFTVIMRRSFGVAGNNYATPLARPTTRVVWPAADVGGIPPEGGIEAAYKRQLAEAADPVALRAELEARIESARGPVGPLNRFQMEEMIDPRDTRRYVCDWVRTAYHVVQQPGSLGARAIQFRP